MNINKVGDVSTEKLAVIISDGSYTKVTPKVNIMLCKQIVQHHQGGNSHVTDKQRTYEGLHLCRHERAFLTIQLERLVLKLSNVVILQPEPHERSAEDKGR